MSEDKRADQFGTVLSLLYQVQAMGETEISQRSSSLTLKTCVVLADLKNAGTDR